MVRDKSDGVSNTQNMKKNEDTSEYNNNSDNCPEGPESPEGSYEDFSSTEYCDDEFEYEDVRDSKDIQPMTYYNMINMFLGNDDVPEINAENCLPCSSHQIPVFVNRNPLKRHNTNNLSYIDYLPDKLADSHMENSDIKSPKYIRNVNSFLPKNNTSNKKTRYDLPEISFESNWNCQPNSSLNYKTDYMMFSNSQDEPIDLSMKSSDQRNIKSNNYNNNSLPERTLIKANDEQSTTKNIYCKTQAESEEKKNNQNMKSQSSNSNSDIYAEHFKRYNSPTETAYLKLISTLSQIIKNLPRDKKENEEKEKD